MVFRPPLRRVKISAFGCFNETAEQLAARPRHQVPRFISAIERRIGNWDDSAEEATNLTGPLLFVF
ncbi:hypothetical protein I6F26_28915 [Ensifer sp. IC3342]|nr:hypothetical protein [Ensifer sp. BRP08]MCA1450564.1 hypothetical protein [Ensifer sp. IC3342]